MRATLNSLRYAVCGMWIFGLSVAGGGCSDRSMQQADGSRDDAASADATKDEPSGGETTSEAGTDARPDAAQPDAVSSDAVSPDGNVDAAGEQTCSPRPIWPQDASGFAYNRSGGFVAPPPPDAGCTDVGTLYQFSSAAMTLSLRACDFSGRTDVTVHLSQPQLLQIVASLQGFSTICPGRNCGADYPSVVLTVQVPPTQSVAYSSDFYAGCQGAIVSPPFVSYQSLGAFETLLASIVTSACRPDGGGTTDAGSCTRGQPDGGSSDAGVDARECTGTAPNCFGNNLGLCCGNDPSGPAVCRAGTWMCGPAVAPGCSGTSCLLRQDAGTDARE